MGKEATVHYQFGEASGQAKALLETNELILRDLHIRSPKASTQKAASHKISLASITNVKVKVDQLHFEVGTKRLTLTLGESEAKSWAKKLTTPPPTLASKLGITPNSHLLLIGDFATLELTQATAQAASTESHHPDLILANIRTITDLNHVLDIYKSHPNNPPIWIIYPKGVKSSSKPNNTAGETAVREMLRQEGLIDTKIASVSAVLTGLRFMKRS